MTKGEVLKAIREKCLDCSCDSYTEVKECSIRNCPLYIFRFGKDPKPSRSRQKAGARLGNS